MIVMPIWDGWSRSVEIDRELEASSVVIAGRVRKLPSIEMLVKPEGGVPAINLSIADKHSQVAWIGFANGIDHDSSPSSEHSRTLQKVHQTVMIEHPEISCQLDGLSRHLRTLTAWGS
jgi:hypothetical protein